jgi:hypothetical protein
MTTTLAQLVSLIALAGCLLPAILLFLGTIDHARALTITLVATLIWFVATPFWMSRNNAA